MKKQTEKTELKWYEKKSGRKTYHFQKESVKESLNEKENKTLSNKKSNSKPDYKKKNFKINESIKTTDISVKCNDSLFDVNSIPLDAKEVINSFNKIILSVFPLSSKQKALLPNQIRELSHNLTDERSSRRLGYMNQTTTLSSYIHYYLWWNIVRLTRLFSNIDNSFFNLNENDICLDIGCGPLTVPICLFLTRPELRSKKLTWYCLDISMQALNAGENIFYALAAKLKCEPWKIIKVKGELGTSIKQKASLITCANVFNEIVQDNDMPPDYIAKKYSEKLLSYTDSAKVDSRILVIEPGVPYSARFISLLRDALIRKSYIPVSPCPHIFECNMQGKKGGKWCNFAFNTDSAPQELKKLSEKAYLPKERAVLSFVACKKNYELKDSDNDLTFRIASDPIHLPFGATGYYACSKKGMLLIKSKAKLLSGQSYTIKEPKRELLKDEKSGAMIIDL